MLCDGWVVAREGEREGGREGGEGGIQNGAACINQKWPAIGYETTQCSLPSTSYHPTPRGEMQSRTRTPTFSLLGSCTQVLSVAVFQHDEEKAHYTKGCILAKATHFHTRNEAARLAGLSKYVLEGREEGECVNHVVVMAVLAIPKAPAHSLTEWERGGCARQRRQHETNGSRAGKS